MSAFSFPVPCSRTASDSCRSLNALASCMVPTIDAKTLSACTPGRGG